MKKIEVNAEAKATITNTVEAMDVSTLRKAASKYGIKFASKYRKVELSQMLIDAMLAERLAAMEAIVAADAEEEIEEVTEATETTEAAEEATESEVEAEAEEVTEAEPEAPKSETKAKNFKRYKADKVPASEVAQMASELIAAGVQNFDLFAINRKVLIEVMKALHCEKWYRTYDKPTMISKITAAAIAA